MMYCEGLDHYITFPFEWECSTSFNYMLNDGLPRGTGKLNNELNTEYKNDNESERGIVRL